jgi:uncharacterized protein YigE (DUF2233 family)
MRFQKDWTRLFFVSGTAAAGFIVIALLSISALRSVNGRVQVGRGESRSGKSSNGEVHPHSDPYFNEVSRRGHSFYLVLLEGSIRDLRLVWRGPAGERFGSFSAVREHFGGLVFATNAGMYNPQLAPVGLHIEEGRLLSPLDNQSDLPGNFYLAPNGVFFITKSGAAEVLDTVTFQQRGMDDLRLATQSGPMLVLNGHMHPNFSETSTSSFIRSGVGVQQDGSVVFVISKEPVNFFTFATLFRDDLSCRNALYLDGGISKFYAPQLGLTDLGAEFVGMLAVIPPILPGPDL